MCNDENKAAHADCQEATKQKMLYKILIDDIRNTKQLIWNNLYLTVIAVGGIISVYKIMPACNIEKCLVSITILIIFILVMIGAIGIISITVHYFSIEHYRELKNNLQVDLGLEGLLQNARFKQVEKCRKFFGGKFFLYIVYYPVIYSAVILGLLYINVKLAQQKTFSIVPARLVSAIFVGVLISINIILYRMISRYMFQPEYISKKRRKMEMNKKWLCPLIILLILLAAYGMRWSTDAFTVHSLAVTKWKTDRWIGNTWRYHYSPGNESVVLIIPNDPSSRLIRNDLTNAAYRRQNIATGIWIVLFSASAGWLFYAVAKKDRNAES